MSTDTDEILDRLTERLGEDDRVHTAWVFGSSARDEAHPKSDLDLAIWTDQPLSLDERLRLSAGLQEDLDDVELDVVYLNEAGPVLRYEVVRDGRRLHSNDGREADAFEHRATMTYLDTAYYRRLQRDLARDAVE